MDWIATHADPELISYPITFLGQIFKVKTLNLKWNLPLLLESNAGLYYTIVNIFQSTLFAYINGCDFCEVGIEQMNEQISDNELEMFKNMTKDCCFMISNLIKVPWNKLKTMLIKPEEKPKEEKPKPIQEIQMEKSESNLKKKKKKRKKNKNGKASKLNEDEDKLSMLNEIKRGNPKQKFLLAQTNIENSQLVLKQNEILEIEQNLDVQQKIYDEIKKIKINFNKLNFRYRVKENIKIIIFSKLSEFIRKNFYNYNIFKSIRIYQEKFADYNIKIKDRIYQENINKVYNENITNYKYKRKRIRYMSQDNIKIPDGNFSKEDSLDTETLIIYLENAIRMNQKKEVVRLSQMKNFKQITKERLDEIGYFALLQELK
jgi:hypothetical protein